MTTQTAPIETYSLIDNVKICAAKDICELEDLHERTARRAKELFDAHGGGHGYDWHDWFRAEAELLRPVEFEVIESDQEVRVRAVVLGFEAEELKLAVEPRQAILYGKKRLTPEVGNKVFYVEWVPDEIFKIIVFPLEVVPEKAVCTLHSGVLELVVPTK